MREPKHCKPDQLRVQTLKLPDPNPVAEGLSPADVLLLLVGSLPGAFLCPTQARRKEDVCKASQTLCKACRWQDATSMLISYNNPTYGCRVSLRMLPARVLQHVGISNSWLERLRKPRSLCARASECVDTRMCTHVHVCLFVCICMYGQAEQAGK